MFISYLIIALQSLKKQPAFSIIKILSLAIGIGCSILVIMHVQYANSFDKHFPNWQNTYRLVSSFNIDQRMNTDSVPSPWAPQLLLDYPQIELIANIRAESGMFSRGNEASRSRFYFAEPDIIPIFSLEFISGDPLTALDAPFSIVLTETTAEKYFPGEDALGKTLTAQDQFEVNITGVIKDLPENTHLDIPMLVSVSTGKELFGEDFMAGNSWFGFQGTRTYLTFSDKAAALSVSNDLDAFLERNLPAPIKEFAESSELSVYLESIGEIYFSPFIGFGGTNNKPRVMLGLSIFAILILLTSCINFANLSLSQIQQRSKEIGVRKTLGAKRRQIVLQFLFESWLLTALALLLAIPFVYFVMPVYTNMTNTGFTYATILQSNSVLTLVTFVIATGTISGLFPALALSRFQAASIIKGENSRSKLSQLVRPLVTVIQFGFSTSLIILAIAITQQINYLNTMDNGFTKDNLLILPSTFSAMDPEQFDYAAMVNELRQGPGILSVGKSGNTPPGTGPLNPWTIPSFPPGETRGVRHIMVDEQYVETMGFTLLAGRSFSTKFQSDFIDYAEEGVPNDERPVSGIVITRYAASSFGFSSPEAAVGEIFNLFGLTYQVLGVIEDFRFSGGLEDTLLSTQIMRASLDPLGTIFLRIDPRQTEAALDYIDSVWERHRADIPIDRTFFNQTLDGLIEEQTNGINRAATFASVITVLISAFGLYALAFYTGQRRTKEVGVRKVLGASSNSIIGLLTWDFVQPVLIACVLSWGLAWYAITLFFQQFNSQVDISPIIYIVTTLGTLMLAVLTVATQCYKAANSDPIESLRYE